MHITIAALSRFTSPSGICRHAANLAQCLAMREEIDHITFIHGEWQEYYPSLFIAAGQKLEFRSIGIRNSSLGRNRFFAYRLPRLAESLGTDVLHLSFPVPTSRKQTYKTVVTLHDLYPYDCPEVFGVPNVYFNRMALRKSLAAADAIACVSQSTLERLKFHFSSIGAAKAVVVPNCIGRSEPQTQAPRDWNTSQFVLMVAQHRHNKNLPLAVNSFAAMLHKQVIAPGTSLVIVGCSGPETPSLQQQIDALNLRDNVVLLQSLAEPELQWLYEHCKLFLVTSREEGFCLPLLEALRAGCRVVAADLPVLREIGGGSCVYFDAANARPENVAAAAQSALEVHDRPAPDLRRFSFEAAGEAYVKLYQSLSTNTPAGTPEYVRA